MTKTTTPHFGLLCLASYLLSLSYGSTFLLSLLVTSRGGNEQDAGSIIAIAMLSTVIAVLGSGHLADWLGTARAIAQSALCLIGACLGFALVPGVDFSLWLCGLLLAWAGARSTPWARSWLPRWSSRPGAPTASRCCQAA